VYIRYSADTTITMLSDESRPSIVRSRMRSTRSSRLAQRVTPPSTAIVSTVTVASCQKPLRAYSA